MWDFELLKVEGIFVGSKMAITAIEFVKEYPLMVAASVSGIISIYAVRGAPRRLRNRCLGRFLNVGYDSEKYTNIPITGLTVELIPNPRYNPEEKVRGEMA
jgi:hypothetical protein